MSLLTVEPLRDRAEDLCGLRVGVARTQVGHEVSHDVGARLAAAAQTMRELGLFVVDVDLPSLDDARTAMWTISAVDGAEFHLPLLRDANGSSRTRRGGCCWAVRSFPV